MRMPKSKTGQEGPQRRIPVPDRLMGGRPRWGKFQGGSCVTLREVRGAVEAFTGGRVTVMTRRETEALRGREGAS